MMFPNKNLVVYLNGKNAQNGKQLESDNELQEWLRKRHGMRVLSIMYGGKSKGETERIVNEIVREVKKNDA
jgi:predicted CopG family antitoxin